MVRIRLDQLLLDRGLAESKTRAQALILSGNVYTENKRLDKPGQQVKDDVGIIIKGQEHPWVSRGGLKLEKALDHFDVDVTGMTAIDVGASTGGFTDVLLHHGAAKVYAVDVGHGQLAWKLREDERVVVLEKTNARYLTKAEIPGPVDLVVCDASFISLKTVLPAVLRLTKLCSPLRGERTSIASRGGVKPFPEKHRKFAGEMRKQPTEAEKKLWYSLKGKQMQGYGFRRQQPIGPYIVDFICFEKKLIIEVDGGQHAESSDDEKRDRFLKHEGYHVLRFWNNEVLQNSSGVVERIEETLLHLPETSAAEGHDVSAPPSRRGNNAAHLITLIKPQFEVGKEQVGKGGVVRDEALHQAVCSDISDWVNGLEGWQVVGVTGSPITGPKGNKEFLLYAVRKAA